MEFVWRDGWKPQKASVNILNLEAHIWTQDHLQAIQYSRVSFFVTDTDKPISIIKHVFGSKNLQNISERL
jgi:hypothetical protein